MNLEEPKLVTMVFGHIQIDIPENMESIEIVRKLLNILESQILGAGIEKTIIPKPDNSKNATNACKCTNSELKGKDTQKDKDHTSCKDLGGKETELKTILAPKGQDIFVPRFSWDKTKEKLFGMIFLYEDNESGNTMIRYVGSCFFVNKERVSQIPYPIPQRYEPLKSLPCWKRAAVGHYRRYLFQSQSQPQSQLQPHSQETVSTKPLPVAVEDDLNQSERTTRIKNTAEHNFSKWQKKPESENGMSERTRKLRDGVAMRAVLGIGAEQNKKKE